MAKRNLPEGKPCHISAPPAFLRKAAAMSDEQLQRAERRAWDFMWKVDAVRKAAAKRMRKAELRYRALSDEQQRREGGGDGQA